MSALSARARKAVGRALRTTTKRSQHAVWQPTDARPDPIATLRATESERLTDLLGLRYSRMAASAFGFLRGSASIMAADLGTTAQSGLRVQACGDAHIGNFRLLGTPERKLNFDLNDFDETLPAPFEWDLKRLAASSVVAARQNGYSPRVSGRVADHAARAYRVRMAEYARRRTLDVWYSKIDRATLAQVLQRAKLDATQHRLARKQVTTALGKDNLKAVRKLTTIVDGVPRLRDDPPVLYHVDQDDELVRRAVLEYRGTQTTPNGIISGCAPRSRRASYPGLHDLRVA